MDKTETDSDSEQTDGWQRAGEAGDREAREKGLRSTGWHHGTGAGCRVRTGARAGGVAVTTHGARRALGTPGGGPTA